MISTYKVKKALFRNKILKRLREGRIVKGIVRFKDNETAIIQICFKFKVEVNDDQLWSFYFIKKHDTIKISITNIENKNYKTTILEQHLDKQSTLNYITQYKNQKRPIKGKVLKVIKFGFIIKICEHYAILPMILTDFKHKYKIALNAILNFYIFSVNTQTGLIILHKLSKLKEVKPSVKKKITWGIINCSEDSNIIVTTAEERSIIRITDLCWELIVNIFKQLVPGTLIKVQIEEKTEDTTFVKPLQITKQYTAVFGIIVKVKQGRFITQIKANTFIETETDKENPKTEIGKLTLNRLQSINYEKKLIIIENNKKIRTTLNYLKETKVGSETTGRILSVKNNAIEIELATDVIGEIKTNKELPFFKKTIGSIIKVTLLDYNPIINKISLGLVKPKLLLVEKPSPSFVQQQALQ